MNSTIKKQRHSPPSPQPSILPFEACSPPTKKKKHQFAKVTSYYNEQKYYFTEEIMNMMHAFGDSNQPLVESANLIESIVHEQLGALIEKAKHISQVRNSQVIGAEDILFLLRKDKSKLARLINHLYVKDIKSSMNDGSNVQVELRDAMRSQKTRRVKICYDYMSQIDEFGEYKKVFNQALFDEIKNQRLRRIDSITRNMSQIEYMKFTQARQVSFLSKMKPEKFSEWVLSDKPDIKISLFAFEMVQYLAHETVAQVVDLALIVKQDAEREPNNPLSALITKSCHNTAERVSFSSYSYDPSTTSNNPTNPSINITANVNQQAIPTTTQTGHFDIPNSFILSLGCDNRNSVEPYHIHEAMRRFCAPVGSHKFLELKNRDSSIVILSI